MSLLEFKIEINTFLDLYVKTIRNRPVCQVAVIEKMAEMWYNINKAKYVCFLRGNK